MENATVSAVGTPVTPATTDVFGHYELVLPSGSGVSYTVRAGGGGAGMGADQVVVELVNDLTYDFHLPLQYAEDFETGTFVVYPWEMSGTADWTLVTDTVHEGVYAARSGDITHNQDSIMELAIDVAVEGDISFFYSVSSESGYDYLRFYVDDVKVDEWSGSVAWTEFTHTLTAGTHTVTWAYEKDTSLDDGSDCAWVDFIVFPTIVPPSFPEIGLDVAGFDVTLAPDGTTVLPMTIANSDEGALEFEISLVEADGAILAVETPAVPYRDFGKDEIDDPRAGGSADRFRRSPTSTVTTGSTATRPAGRRTTGSTSAPTVRPSRSKTTTTPGRMLWASTCRSTTTRTASFRSVPTVGRPSRPPPRPTATRASPTAAIPTTCWRRSGTI